ncbi:MAG: hypothetical protein ACRDHP_08100 [Ktedonobacterales bacterium]
MIEVKRLVWDEWNIRYIVRHDVTPEEVEEVCHGAFVASETYSNRLRIVGPTNAQRMLAVIVGKYAETEGAYYVVTAHSANAGETKRYRELKGTTNEEKQ